MYRIILFITALLFSLSSISDDAKTLTQLASNEILRDDKVSVIVPSMEKTKTQESASKLKQAEKQLNTAVHHKSQIGPYNSRLWWFLIGAMSLWVLFDMWKRRQ